jgi:hypothetical protein
MLNFNQLINLIDGDPYETIPTVPDNSWALTPLEDKDLATTSAADVVDNMRKMKTSGYNPTRLGPPMTDDEFAKYTGQT